MGRIRDAWRTLVWGSPSTEVARIRAEWAELQLEVANVLEQLNVWAARQAKRESRAAKRQLESAAAPPEQVQLQLPPGSAKSRKAELRARLSQMRASALQSPDQQEAIGQ